ncbi:response regulator (plasmid) [Halopseudomonas sp. SMJS2]|uniref:hybrid sensor histidine kinase/response regulator n=1 Tax=Halopseudomonas sp. SMJS2 TaxID=3041098 RepID=UPI002453340E|nr:response regulator [Halopseudomonas sp. SMJS2]WGK63388.1 response regulator [Halopseudomonas sp. SMJS2]
MAELQIAHVSWIRKPIAQSVEQAQLAMETYAARKHELNNPPSGAQPAWLANKKLAAEAAYQTLKEHVEQCHCAISMVGSNGAAALTQELLVLCTNIEMQSMSSEEESRALTTIQSGLLVLPGYLKMVIDGSPDNAGILSKYINDVREIRNVPLMAGDNLLPSNLAFVFSAPPGRSDEVAVAERQSVFADAGSEFQKGFAEFIGSQSKSALERMRVVLSDLMRVTRDIEIGCAWWVGARLLTEMQTGSVKPASNTLSNIRMLSVAVQKLSSGGETAAREAMGIDRFKAILYALSLAVTPDPETQELLHKFNIGRNAGQDEIQQLQSRLEAAQADSLDDVVVELKPHLEAAMVSLGRALSAKNDKGFLTQMEVFTTSMKIIANVFSMIGEDKLSASTNAMLSIVVDIDQQRMLSEEIVEKIKTQVLFVDQQLSQLEANDATKALMIEGISADVITALVHETQREIISVRKKIAIHVESGIETDSLLEGLENLSSTATAFEFSGGVNISNLLKGVASALITLVEDRRLTNSDRLDLAARALVAVEMYFDALINDLAPDHRMLTHAEEALSNLGVSVEHVHTFTSHDLLLKFDEGIDGADANVDDDPFLAEIFELREHFEVMLSNPEIQRYQNYKNLYEASSRLAAAAQIAGLTNLSDLCKGLSAMAKIAPGQINDSLNDPKAAQGLAKQACEMVIRGMDEYLTKGSVSLFLRPITDALTASYGDSPLATAEDALEASQEHAEVVQTERECPPDVDPVLIELFRQEANEQYEKLFQFIVSKRNTVSQDESRAVHTLNGISGSAGCLVLKRVYGALEVSLSILAGDNTGLSPEKMDMLGQLLEETRAFQLEYPWQRETDLEHVWIKAAKALMDGCSAQSEPREFQDNPVSVSNLSCANESASDRSEAAAPKKHSHANAFVAQAKEPQSQDEIEYNLEMASFYLDDAEELLPALTSNVDAWYDKMHDKDLNDEIKRNMHTLKGAAGIAEAKSISDLTHNMESLFESFELGIIQPNEDAAEIVRLVLDSLQNLTEAVRAERSYERPVTLIAFLDNAVADNKIDLSALALGAERESLPDVVKLPSPNTEPQAKNEASTSGAPSTFAADSPVTELRQPAQEADRDTKPKTRRGRRGSRGRKPSSSSDVSSVSTETNSEVERGVLSTSPEITATVPASEPESEIQVPAEAPRQSANKNFMSALLDEEADQDEEVTGTSIPSRGPLASDKVISMLDRLETKLSSESGNQRKKGSSEKIKVDQRLLETAVVNASELNASRHRQQAQHEEAMLMLTSLREKLSLHLLEHNQFTNALRGYINQPSTLQRSTDHSDLQLERFNYLSSMHVQSGMHIEQMFQDVEDIFEQNSQIQASYSEQAALIRSLQRDLLDSRLVPFMNIRQALQSVVDQTGRAVGKLVKSEFVGADTIVDKVLLESIRDPLTHIIKNAIDHGLEGAEERLTNDKNPHGTVVVSVSRRGKSVYVTVTDDGRGIDPEVIRKKAIDKKIIRPDADLTRRELLNLITANGFTTTDKVTTISGRGVGMDIVKAAVERIGGLLTIESEIEKGTTFTMELPFTIGSNRAVVCQAGEQWFAIPSYNMTQILEFSVAELAEKRQSGQRPQLEFEYASYDIVHLSELIAMPELRLKKQSSVMTTLILCSQGDTRIAIEVDKGGSMPEIHVRKLEGILSRLKGIIGEASIHDGSPVLVLDVMELARHNLKLTDSGYQVRLNRVRNIRRDEKPLVLVVDDSSGYRKLLSKHFESRGFTVEIARDGQDAIDKFPMERTPDLIMVDVEMPRIDGFELTNFIRSRAELAAVPIIMLTTRTGLAEKAYEAGVNVFMNKPCDGQALDSAISQVLPSVVLAGAV